MLMGPERFFFFFSSDRGNELWPCEQMWLIQVQTQHTGTHTQTQWVNRIWGSTWWTSSVFPPPRLVCRRRCLPTSQDIFNLWPSHPHRPLKSRTAARAFCVCSKSERLRNAALAAAHVRDGLRQYLSKGRRSGQHVVLGRCERFLSPSHATKTHRLQLRQTDTYKMPLRKIFIVVVIYQAFAQSFHSSFHVLPVS